MINTDFSENLPSILSRCGFMPKAMVDPSEITRQQAQSLGRLRASCKNGGLCVLHGPRGTGKTVIACQLVREYLLSDDYQTVPVSKREKIEPRYWLTFCLLAEFVDSRTRREGKTANDLIRICATPQILVLDEFSVRSGTAAEQNFLRTLIDVRYGHALPTVLITNATKKQLAQDVGDSIVSRQQESGCCIECNWPSFRA